MVVSARRREMNGVRNDIRSAIGLAGGGGANGDKNGVASARGIAVWLRRGAARAARGGSLAGSRPGFFQKKPEKLFLEICKLLP